MPEATLFNNAGRIIVEISQGEFQMQAHRTSRIKTNKSPDSMLPIGKNAGSRLFRKNQEGNPVIK